MQKLPSVFVGFGLFLLVLAVILGWIVGPFVLKSQITGMTRLENGTYTWEKWSKPTNKIFLKVYIFNVTNPFEVENGDVPLFHELGPYTYEEKRIKENIEYDDNTDTLNYTQPVWFHFRPDLSSGLESDRLTVINLPLIGVSQRLSKYSRWIRYLMGMFLLQYEENVFIQRNVSQMLFQGYHSPMVNELQSLTGETFFEDAIVGILVGRNGSDEGVYEVNAGNKDFSKFGEVVSWNAKTHLTWPGAPCNLINGTDGSLLPPSITKQSILRGFHPDACRSFYVTFSKDVEFNGVPGYRFEAPEDQYLSPKSNPDNWCFCLNPGQNFSNCYENGVIDGSSCHKDAPITLSNPHFLYAPHYLNLTRGLAPNKDRHGLYAEVEPNTGLILRASRRLQINLDLKPEGAIPGMRNVPEMQFPLAWVDESFYLDQEMHSSLLSLFLLASSLLEYGRWVLLGISLILISTAVSINFIRARKKPYIYD